MVQTQPQLQNKFCKPVLYTMFHEGNSEVAHGSITCQLSMSCIWKSATQRSERLPWKGLLQLPEGSMNLQWNPFPTRVSCYSSSTPGQHRWNQDVKETEGTVCLWIRMLFSRSLSQLQLIGIPLWGTCAKHFQYHKVVIGGARVDIKSKLDGEEKVEAGGRRDIRLLEGSQKRLSW